MLCDRGEWLCEDWRIMEMLNLVLAILKMRLTMLGFRVTDRLSPLFEVSHEEKPFRRMLEILLGRSYSSSLLLSNV